MGKIRKILETELVGGTQSTDVYPVTSTKAVYDTNNKVLDDYIQHLKKTSTFAGIATPTTNPDTPDGPVFYIAGEGTYVNFSNLVIGVGQLGILKWDGTWSKQVLEIGAGGGSGGGSGVSLGTLLTKLNSDNPFPTDNGQVLTYNGSNFIWKTPTGGSGGSTTGGIRIKRNGSTLKDSTGNVLSCTSINFKYGENWNSTPILINSDNEISVDLSVVANNGNGSSSSTLYPLTIYNGSSNNDYITYDGSSSAYLKFKSGFSISKVGLGYEISVSGGGSGSSGTTAGKLYFSKDTESDREAYWNGESNFRIIFGSGLNVSWDSTTQITLSATGGSGGGSTSTSVSWTDVTNKPSTFTPSSHTHSANEINGLSGVKVNNAANADTATKLANSRTIWGQSFDGTGNINGNLKMSSAGGNSIQLWMNNGNMLDRTNNILHIGHGLKESSDGEINLDAYRTVVYTDNMSKHYDFKSNVFDVNSNQIHFGSETNGGKISWDAANNAFKIEGNVYATGGITALGVSNNATTSNNVDFTFRSVTSPTYKFNNGSYLTEESINKIHTLKLYHTGSSQYIRLSDSYEYIDDGNNFLGNIIDSSCMSFMNADWYYFDNTIVAPEIYTKGISFFDIDGNQGARLSDIAVSKVSSQTRLLFTINGIQYSVNAN